MLFRILKINIILENVKISNISLQTSVIFGYARLWMIDYICLQQARNQQILSK